MKETGPSTNYMVDVGGSHQQVDTLVEGFWGTEKVALIVPWRFGIVSTLASLRLESGIPARLHFSPSRLNSLSATSFHSWLPLAISLVYYASNTVIITTNPVLATLVEKKHFCRRAPSSKWTQSRTIHFWVVYPQQLAASLFFVHNCCDLFLLSSLSCGYDWLWVKTLVPSTLWWFNI